MNKILVIAPHPDDETLGCGGSLFRYKQDGYELYWVIVTNISENNGWPNKVVKSRDVEINSVAKKFEFQDVFKFCLPTTRIDALPLSDLIEKITKVYMDFVRMLYLYS